MHTYLLTYKHTHTLAGLPITRAVNASDDITVADVLTPLSRFDDFDIYPYKLREYQRACIYRLNLKHLILLFVMVCIDYSFKLSFYFSHNVSHLIMVDVILYRTSTALHPIPREIMQFSRTCEDQTWLWSRAYL